MKLFPHLFFVTMLCFVFGCSNMHQTVQKHRNQLAGPLGVDEEGIHILSYCGVKVANERTKTVTLPSTRIIALTEEAMFLFSKNAKKAPYQPIIRIPLKDVREVSLLKSEVLMRHENRLLIIALYDKNIYDEDRTGTQDLFSQLVAKGVSQYTAEEVDFSIPPRGGSGQRYYNQYYQPRRINDRWLNGGVGNNSTSRSGNNTYINY